MYLSRQDLEDRLSEPVLIELTSDDGQAVNWNLVDRAIAFAEAEVNSYLGARYPVPLQEVPLILRERCTDIAVYHLYKKRAGEAAVEVPEEVRRAYEDALQWLRAVRDGKATLAGVDTQGNPQGDAEQDRVRGYTRQKVFGDRFDREY